jgi:formylglycine-generating enzyme required for sulfatase activity
LAEWTIPIYFSQMKGRICERRGEVTIVERAQLALLFCGILGVAMKLIFPSGTRAHLNTTGSTPGEPSMSQTLRKAPAEMVWIPGGWFLMGTKEKESFPSERPAHLVQVQSFWMDQHDVTNAEFADFVEATGYVTTAERKVDWEELKLELPLGTLKPEADALAPGSLVFISTSGPVAAQRSIGLVALDARSELAASRRPNELYRGKRKSPSASGLLVRRGGLCKMGG